MYKYALVIQPVLHTAYYMNDGSHHIFTIAKSASLGQKILLLRFN